ncbi:MAG: DUF6868 family protein [Planctomycetota bacterium]|jgi:hypothetical protein
MTLEFTREFLLWCTIINSGMLMVWFVFFAVARDWVHSLHGKWFRLSSEQFDAAHYNGMGIFKIVIILFNLVPLIVLYIVG